MQFSGIIAANNACYYVITYHHFTFKLKLLCLGFKGTNELPDHHSLRRRFTRGFGRGNAGLSQNQYVFEKGWPLVLGKAPVYHASEVSRGAAKKSQRRA